MRGRNDYTRRSRQVETVDALYARWGGDLPARETFDHDPLYSRVKAIVISDKLGDPSEFILGIGGFFPSPQDALSDYLWSNGVPVLLIDLTEPLCRATFELSAEVHVAAREQSSRWADPDAGDVAIYPIEQLFKSGGAERAFRRRGGRP